MRDVISTEMWEALNSFYLGLGRYDLSGRARDRAVLGLPGGQGALRAVLGPARPDDAARRGPLVPRGRRPDRGGRHGAADAAGGGPAGDRSSPARGRGARAAARGRRLPGLPPRGAGGADLLGRSSASCSTRAPTRARWPRRSPPARGARDRRRAAPLLAAGAPARPADRRPGAPARAPRPAACFDEMLERVQDELELSITTSTSATLRSPPLAAVHLERAPMWERAR
jgi:hypothetical protein